MIPVAEAQHDDVDSGSISTEQAGRVEQFLEYLVVRGQAHVDGEVELLCPVLDGIYKGIGREGGRDDNRATLHAVSLSTHALVATAAR